MTQGKLPAALAENGYVADLILTIERAAESIGARCEIHEKDGDYFVGVRVPTQAELDAMERDQEEPPEVATSE